MYNALRGSLNEKESERRGGMHESARESCYKSRWKDDLLHGRLACTGAFMNSEYQQSVHMNAH